MNKTHEVLDVLDWVSGQPTGNTVLRTEAHKRGIPHKAMHLWVYARWEGRLVLLFQQRSFEKPNFPGFFGPTVGGHVSSGEGQEALVREAEEEIGIQVNPGQMEFLGYNPFHFSLGPGYEDFEWIEDWRCFSQLPPESYRFFDQEVIGMLAIEPQALALVPQGPQRAIFFDGSLRRELTVQVEDFVSGLFDSPLFPALVQPIPFVAPPVN